MVCPCVPGRAWAPGWLVSTSTIALGFCGICSHMDLTLPVPGLGRRWRFLVPNYL